MADDPRGDGDKAGPDKRPPKRERAVKLSRSAAWKLASASGMKATSLPDGGKG
ncbi:hypothetical protein [Kaistia sp. MMO-174]|uniref:hypothetical protein n=1 Tax=Kaistia sp. MMO-174 TaxID=3081256 RepID=UPI001AC428FE|nr:hypothetical protein [Hyphomicrobiales bacterium]